MYCYVYQHMQFNQRDMPHKRKDKNHMIIWIDAEKASDKIQPPFMIKTLTIVDIKGTYLNIIKTIYDRSIFSMILNSEKLKDFLIKSETKQNIENNVPYLLCK